MEGKPAVFLMNDPLRFGFAAKVPNVGKEVGLIGIFIAQRGGTRGHSTESLVKDLSGSTNVSSTGNMLDT